MKLGPHKPMVRGRVGGQPLTFMIDTGDEHSVVTTPVAPPSGREVSIVGAMGRPSEPKKFCPAGTIKLDGHQVRHQFLYLPKCPVPLLGRDLLGKLSARVAFHPTGQATLELGTSSLVALVIPWEEEYQIHEEGRDLGSQDLLIEEFPDVWAEGNPPGLATSRTPVIIDLKPGAQPRCLIQYHISKEVQLGISGVIDKYLSEGILVPRQSQRNTPLLPVKKPDGSGYRPVQDLRAINEVTLTAPYGA